MSRRVGIMRWHQAPPRASRSRLFRLFPPILLRPVRLERPQQPRRDSGYLIDSRQERALIYFRWLVEAADLSYELKCSRSNLFLRDRRIKIVKGLYVSAHLLISLNHLLASTRY